MSAPMPFDLGAIVPATTEMEDAVAGGGDGALTMPAPAPTCPVCMEPWTCTGDHRICCIPCGHVYGRSCLERWLHRCGDDTAKCPQCGEQFEHNLIINLYAPGNNLWDGCCRLQEAKAHYHSKIRETVAHSATMIAEEKVRSQSRFDIWRAALLEQSAIAAAENDKKRAEFEGNMRVETELFRADLVKKLEQMVGPWIADLTTMKERMKKMAEEEKATATELIEFMELNFPQLSLISNPFAFDSGSAPAHVDSENNERLRRSDADQPVPTPPGPADAANKRLQTKGGAEGPDIDQ